MNQYEAIAILSPDVSDEQKEEIVNKMKTLITSEGELISVDDWGRKTLAYMINKKSEGIYILFTFNAKAQFISEFERVLRLNEKVLKHMVVKKNK